MLMSIYYMEYYYYLCIVKFKNYWIMMLAFILICVAIMVIDEAKRKGYDLRKMRDELNKVEE